MEPSSPSKKPNTVLIRFNLTVVCIVLVLIIAAMIALWRPWEDNSVSRKITISGEASVEAAPDNFVFNPSFEREGTDTEAMKTELNDFGTKLIDDMKKLGIKEDDITIDSSSYDQYRYAPNNTEEQTVSLYASITALDKDTAQKVQNYLANTDATGQITPYATFSKDKQKQLENEARNKAIADARSKASTTASNLDGSVGKVLDIKDSDNYYGGYITEDLSSSAAMEAGPKRGLPITAGKSEISVQVQVIFALK